jgi:tripartite-type tricarboxylate transporter receptor subunit TctC
VIALLNPEIALILKQPDVPKRLLAHDLKPAHASPEDFARRVAQDIAMWANVARISNIRIDSNP